MKGCVLDPNMAAIRSASFFDSGLPSHIAKVVPIAGQVASAAIGFALFRKMGYQHVEACANVARELQKARVIDMGTAPV